jgi:hypothetical protein
MFTRIIAVLVLLMSIISCKPVNDVVPEAKTIKDPTGLYLTTGNPDNAGNYSMFKALNDLLDLKEEYEQYFPEGCYDADPNSLLLYGIPELRPYVDEVSLCKNLIQGHLHSEDIISTDVIKISDSHYLYPELIFKDAIYLTFLKTGLYDLVKADDFFYGWPNGILRNFDGREVRFDTVEDIYRGVLLADLYRGLSTETISAMFRNKTDRGIAWVPYYRGKYLFPAWPFSKEYNEFQVFYFFDNSAQALSVKAQSAVRTQMKKWETALNTYGQTPVVFVDVRTSEGAYKYKRHFDIVI